MSINGLDPELAEKEWGDFMAAQCVCRTCRYMTRELFQLRCDHPELEYSFRVKETDACECHTFADESLERENDRLADRWVNSIDWEEVKAECDREFAEQRKGER